MNISLRRHALGIFSLLLLTSAVGLLVSSDSDDNQMWMAGSICLRAGLTLGAIWLALPQVIAISAKFSPRLLVAILVGGMIVIARPRTFPLVALIVAAVGVIEFVGWLFRPLPPKKKRSGQSQKQ
jgi:hypothetical protein